MINKRAVARAMMLTDSIVNQIIDQHCNQLFSKDAVGEWALFGGNAQDNLFRGTIAVLDEEILDKLDDEASKQRFQCNQMSSF